MLKKQLLLVFFLLIAFTIILYRQIPYVLEPKPKALDTLISYDLPDGFTLSMEYPYLGEDEKPIVQRGYTHETMGVFTAGIFSYKEHDCLGNISQTIHVKGHIRSLENPFVIDINVRRKS